jgi:hypothetical protein
VASCCEYGDESSGSCATELVQRLAKRIEVSHGYSSDHPLIFADFCKVNDKYSFSATMFITCTSLQNNCSETDYDRRKQSVKETGVVTSAERDYLFTMAMAVSASRIINVPDGSDS